MSNFGFEKNIGYFCRLSWPYNFRLKVLCYICGFKPTVKWFDHNWYGKQARLDVFKNVLRQRSEFGLCILFVPCWSQTMDITKSVHRIWKPLLFHLWPPEFPWKADVMNLSQLKKTSRFKLNSYKNVTNVLRQVSYRLKKLKYSFYRM